MPEKNDFLRAGTEMFRGNDEAESSSNSSSSVHRSGINRTIKNLKIKTEDDTTPDLKEEK